MDVPPQSPLVLVFANGELHAGAWVKACLARARFAIAADGGVRHLLALGRLPDVLIGDLDSLPTDTEVPEAGEIIRHSPDKNETDLELALLYAVDRYPDAEVWILGGTGGRLDHTLANLLLLAHPRLIGRPIRFVDESESAWLISALEPPVEALVAGAPGDVVSLLPLGGPARVRRTTGLRWPLHDEVLEFGPARGVSNELTAATATVEIVEGMVLCVHMRQTDGVARAEEDE